MKKTNKVFKILLVAILIIATNMITYFFITKKEKIISTENVSLETMQTSASNSYITTEQHLSEIAKTSGIKKKEIASSNILVTAEEPFLRYKATSDGKDKELKTISRKVASFNPNLDSDAKILSVVLTYEVSDATREDHMRQTIALLGQQARSAAYRDSHPYIVICRCTFISVIQRQILKKLFQYLDLLMMILLVLGRII